MTPRSPVNIAVGVAMLAAICAAHAGVARANGQPDFLADGQRYGAETAACAPGAPVDDGPLLTGERLSVYTYDCTFVGFMSRPDGDTGRQTLATAICGDDSGVSWPDMFVLTPVSEDAITVTSQNDYVARRMGEDRLALLRLVEREFVRCP